MQLNEFDYILPQNLIAQHPVEPRDSCKLLCVPKNSEVFEDKVFYELYDMLNENDVLVINKTKVMNARLKGYIKDSEQKVEVFLHTPLGDDVWDCLVYPGRKCKIGTIVQFFGETRDCLLEAEIISMSESGRKVKFKKYSEDFDTIIEQVGEIPLPPYISEKPQDDSQYQTVYSENKGSVAAPTAGLHFTKELLKKLEDKRVKIEKVLLHVGLGTFKGVETEDITQHHMHSEYCEIPELTAHRLNEYKKQGKRIIAVGTTSVRTLESFSDENGLLTSGQKQTNIFIYPGYSWKYVDALITNFHLPKSTLLMLVSSLAGQQTIKMAYTHAIDSSYRFYSFGDAMFIF